MSFAIPSFSPAAWTIVLFGVAAAGTGLQGFLSPASAVASFSVNWVNPSTRPATDLTPFYQSAVSLGALHLGCIYILAAFTDWRPFFYLSVGLRFFSFVATQRKISSGQFDAKFGQMGTADGIGGVITLLALVYEATR